MALTQIDLPSLEKIADGKVRELFNLPDPETLLLVATDRVSAFDAVLKNGIPNKGAILTLISAHWFRVLVDLIPDLRTHFIGLEIPASVRPKDAALVKNRAMHVRKLEVIKIEAIVRGYLTGSAWKEYQDKGTVHGIEMPKGLRLSEKLPQAIYTPSTKAPAWEHDENIHPDDAWKEIGSREVAREVEKLALQIYTVVADYAAERGIIIADTKFEFGRDSSGAIYLVDEVLTPDSSRFWPKDKYEVGKEQDSLDKQYVRNWLLQNNLKGKEDVELPEEVCRLTEERYKEVFRMLTGTNFTDAALE